LLVTNDFPPRPGGIQAYLHALASRLPGELVVYAPAWAGAAEFDAAQPFEVVRHPGTLMLPVPKVLRTATELARSHDCDTVWFGAAAPLALLVPWLRAASGTYGRLAGGGRGRLAGVERVVACTHGHEVGWAMLPGGRQALRRIGSTVDVLTYVSRYTRSRFAAAFGPAAALELLPPGVDTDVYRPDAAGAAEVRRRHGLAGRPVVVCVSRLVPRKGQDVLVRALPRIRRRVPGAALLLVGGGPYRGRLARLAEHAGVAEHVVFTGSVPWSELPAHYAAGDVFAMPCRTHGRGLDVEALGIVFLEAAACGLPVVAGRSGGSPETVREGETGMLVDGRDIDEVAGAVANLLADPEQATKLGSAGRDWMRRAWRWEQRAARLATLLGG